MAHEGQAPHLDDQLEDEVAADYINPTAPAAAAPGEVPAATHEVGEASGHGGASAVTNGLPLATTGNVAASIDNSSAPAVVAPSMHHINITSYVPFKLDLTAGNYSKWRQIMFFIICKFAMQDHIETERDPVWQNATWRHDDITLVL
jgi:hypothetical protein